MNIPIKNIQCTRTTYAGQFTRIVGQVSQTVQCVIAGKLFGTAHLKAKVVRDLTKLFHADCIAGQQLYSKLMDPAIPVSKEYNGNSSIATSNPTARKNKSSFHTSQHSGTKDIYNNISTVLVNNECDDDASSHHQVDSDSNTSFDHETDLANFLAMQSQETRDQAVLDYPKLAKHIQTDVTSSHSSRSIPYSTVSKTKKTKLGSSYFDPASSPRPDSQFLRGSTDAILAAVADQSLGKTDHARIALNNSSTTAIGDHKDRHSMSDSSLFPSSKHVPPDKMVMKVTMDSSSSALSKLSTCPSDLRRKPHSQDSDTADWKPDASSLAGIMAAHGYYDAPFHYQNIQATADTFCRVCYMDNQPRCIMFGHNFMDLSCPSMHEDYDPIMHKDTDSDDSSEDDLHTLEE